MFKFIKTIPAIMLSLSVVGTSVSAAPAENNHHKERYIPVQLLGINDFHGQIDVYRTISGKQVGGAEYLASYLKQYEKDNKNTLLVHTGDVVGASSPVSSLLQDEPTIEILDNLGFDVGTVGNHEFDQGIEEMNRLINGGEHKTTGYFEGAAFPYTAANVVDKDTGEPILPPYVIKKVNGMPIGFIGVVTTETKNIVIPSAIEGVEFLDETTAINNAVKELKEKGVESIVVLAHAPASSDNNGSNASGDVVEFAPHVDDEVDVIYGGHNHAHANTVVDDKLIVQSYSYGTAFSDVDLMIDPKTKDIVEKQASIITTYHEGIEPDSKIKEMVDSYKEEVKPLINQVIGQASTAISTESDDSGESPLGNLIADSQRAVMNSDFAFMNSGGIRANLDQGEIIWGELYTILPFGNSLVKMTLTGEQIKKVLEQQWSGSYPKIMQSSGLEYTWDKNAPVGNKIVEMKDSEGNLIDPSKQYTVTVNNFMATGGDGYTVFAEGKNQELGPLALDALIEYIKKQEGAVGAPAVDRINVK